MEKYTFIFQTDRVIELTMNTAEVRNALCKAQKLGHKVSENHVKMVFPVTTKRNRTTKLKTFIESIQNGRLLWNDPDPILPGKNKINFLRINEDWDTGFIQYNKNSEAEVYLHEILAA